MLIGLDGTPFTRTNKYDKRKKAIQVVIPPSPKHIPRKSWYSECENVYVAIAGMSEMPKKLRCIKFAHREMVCGLDQGWYEDGIITFHMDMMIQMYESSKGRTSLYKLYNPRAKKFYTKNYHSLLKDLIVHEIAHAYYDGYSGAQKKAWRDECYDANISGNTITSFEYTYQYKDSDPEMWADEMHSAIVSYDASGGVSGRYPADALTDSDLRQKAMIKLYKKIFPEQSALSSCREIEI